MQVILNLSITSNSIYVLGNIESQLSPSHWLDKRPRWRKADYRHAYMESAIEQGIAWQIRVNRERRQLSQRDLASKIGSKQSAVSRAEDTTYGRHRLETLVKIAHAFDCALQVRFVPYSTLAKDSHDLAPDALYAKSYQEETTHAKIATQSPAHEAIGADPAPSASTRRLCR